MRQTPVSTCGNTGGPFCRHCPICWRCLLLRCASSAEAGGGRPCRVLSNRTERSCRQPVRSCRCCPPGRRACCSTPQGGTSGHSRPTLSVMTVPTVRSSGQRPPVSAARLGCGVGSSLRFSCQLTSRTNGPFVQVKTWFCRCLLIVSSQGSPLRGGQKHVRERRANGTFMLGERPVSSTCRLESRGLDAECGQSDQDGRRWCQSARGVVVSVRAVSASGGRGSLRLRWRRRLL